MATIQLLGAFRPRATELWWVSVSAHEWVVQDHQFFFFNLFTWRICCCCDRRYLLFLAQPVFNLGLKEWGVRGFLVPRGVQALVWTLSNPLPLPEFAFISDSKEQLLWFICLWSEKDFTRHFLHRNLQSGELQPTARPFQSSVAHAQQIAQPSPPPAALLNGKEDELHPLQLLCYPPKGPICLSLYFQLLCAWHGLLNSK